MFTRSQFLSCSGFLEFLKVIKGDWQELLPGTWSVLIDGSGSAVPGQAAKSLALPFLCSATRNSQAAPAGELLVAASPAAAPLKTGLVLSTRCRPKDRKSSDAGKAQGSAPSSNRGLLVCASETQPQHASVGVQANNNGVLGVCGKQWRFLHQTHPELESKLGVNLENWALNCFSPSLKGQEHSELARFPVLLY